MKTAPLPPFRTARPLRQAGLSLVEIMVALTAGLVMTTVVVQVYLSSRQTYRLEDQYARLQENGRYALDLLVRDLRQTGHLGCRSRGAGTTPIGVLANGPILSPAADPILSGADNTDSATLTHPAPALSTAASAGRTLGNVVRGTDALTVQFAEPLPAPCTGTLTGAEELSAVTGVGDVIANYADCGIKLGSEADEDTEAETGTPLLVSDCYTQQVFRAAADSSQNSSDELAKTFAAGAEIMRFRAYTYYIRRNPSGQPALYRLDNTQAVGGSNPVELAEGVENMQILYGVDDIVADGSATQYLSAAAVTAAAAWNRVINLRVTLTLRSIEDNLASIAREGTFDGADLTDRRLQQQYTATVQLRNRGG